jgi:hypothetical protein
MNTTSPIPQEVQEESMFSYDSMDAINSRKNALRKQIQGSDAEIRILWKSLFRQEQPTTKGMRMSNLMTTGAGILDGVILGWKLYRKFKGFKRK